MGKSSNKSGVKVAPAAVSVSEGKSAKKGKRNAQAEIKKAAVSAKKQKTVVPVKVEPVKKQPPPKKVVSSTSEEESSDSEEEKPAAQLKKPSVASAQKKTQESDSSDSGSTSDDESDDDFPAKAPVAMKKKEESSESSDSESESVSEDEDNNAKKVQPARAAAPKKKEESSDSSESDSESDSDSDEAKTPTKNQSQTTGAKMIFVGNLSYSIEREQVKQFFEEAGEVVDVRLSTFDDGSFKGYGHVEFATAEAAQKALGFTNHDLMGRRVVVDLALESSGRHSSCFKSAPRSGATVYIEGFDTSIGEDQIRSALEEHFRSCGEITRVSIPKDYKTGACKGMAFMDFKDRDSLKKAHELNASELGGCLLYVDEARPRPDP